MKCLTQIICLPSLTLGLSALFLLSPPSVLAEDRAPEGPLRAAFIVNFTKFVTFPQSGDASSELSPDPRTTRKLCVIGDDPLAIADSISQLLKASNLSNLELLSLNGSSGVISERGCDIAYIDSDSSEKACAIVGKLNSSRSVLSIALAIGFVECGGIIELQKIDNRYRFKINRGSAEREGLKLSSQLLSLASSVEEKPYP